VQQILTHGLIWAPILTHSDPTTIKKAIESKGGDWIRRKALIASLWSLAQRQSLLVGLWRSPDLIAMASSQLSDGIQLHMLPQMSSGVSRVEQHLDRHLVATVVI
jgi:hypothetical protein